MFDKSEGIRGLLLLLALAALGIGIAALIESKKKHEKFETPYKPKNMVEACAESGFGRCDLPGCKRCFSIAAPAAGNCFPTDGCPGTFCS